MRYKQRRRLYSQNFLHNPKLTSKLIRRSSIGKNDLVLEIGPGKGNITERLLEIAGHVIAVELDRKLCLHLNLRFRGYKNFELVNKDFLNYQLPNKPFKVFSNIPFNITADVIRKLTSSEDFQEGYLIIQKEAAKRFVGQPYDFKNSMQAMLLKPFFDLEVAYEFRRWDFVPRPNVDSVLLKIKRRENPLIDNFRKNLYRDFVIYFYNKSKVHGLEFEDLLKRFNSFTKSSKSWEKRIISQKAKEIIFSQRNIQKIKRTRNDRKWRNFAKMDKRR